jgi:hypothetical protein
MVTVGATVSVGPGVSVIVGVREGDGVRDAVGVFVGVGTSRLIWAEVEYVEPRAANTSWVPGVAHAA